MRLDLSGGIFISDTAPGDKEACLEHLAEREIYDSTLMIPHPYKPADADWWLNHNAEQAAKLGRSVNWAIREPGGRMIGAIGFHDYDPKSHKVEIGYWLAKPWWGRGIMTEAVRAVARAAFEDFGLVRLTANVFEANARSARVLEKAGFSLEGTLRRFYRKDGRILDGKLYAYVRPDA